MRFRQFLRYPYTADVYDYTINNDANGTLTYAFKETVKVEFGNDPNAPRVNVVCEKPLRRRIIVANVRDRNGKPVLPGAQFTVTSTAPVLSVYGTSEGYVMQAALTNDPTFEGV